MRTLHHITLAGFTMLSLSACGHTYAQRGLSGAAIGAGAGAVGSSVLGGDPVTGAVVGAGVGGVTGVVTK